MVQVSVAHVGHVVYEERVTAFVTPMFEGERDASAALNPEDAKTLARLREAGVLAGKAGIPYFLPTPHQGYRGVLVLGLGKKQAFTAETLRRAAGASGKLLSDHKVSAVVFDASQHADLPVEALIEGLILGQYRCDRYKSDAATDGPSVNVEHVTIFVHRSAGLKGMQKRCERAALACTNANWARDIANMPGNELYPERLAALAQELAKSVGCGCEVLDEVQMAELGMGALLGVGQGSANPPRLILLTHMSHADAETVGILGKGVTFDTGGISIKPGDGMQEMKYDMAGAAAVLGAVKTLCTLKAPVNIVAAVPAVENMPSGTAQRPGDIVRAYNGKTVEIHNTDAEGRLILADALAYVADRYRPARMVDLATLTGGAVVALGHSAAAYMSNDEDLAERLELAADATGERIWRLPLWEDHAKLIEGTHADICNIGPPRDAVPIVGGAFLQAFVGETPWAHIDIAGPAWDVKNAPYWDPKQPTGYGVRLITEWLAGDLA